MPDRLADIRARAAAATPGPWFWGGNVDHNCPSLRTRLPGLGATEVLGAMPVERTAEDRGIRSYLADVEDEHRADMLDGYLHDQYGQPIREQRLTFTVDGLLVEARKLGVFEVARNASDRDDPKVYRADIVDVRHPDARFIAAARADVDWLLAEVDRQRARVSATPLQVTARLVDLVEDAANAEDVGEALEELRERVHAEHGDEVRATIGTGRPASTDEATVVEQLVRALADLVQDLDDPGAAALGALWVGRQYLQTVRPPSSVPA